LIFIQHSEALLNTNDRISILRKSPKADHAHALRARQIKHHRLFPHRAP
jgi:hypothetical protein